MGGRISRRQGQQRLLRVPAREDTGPPGKYPSNPIGVRKARYRASLPSEPDWRVSRIRLSGRWFTDKRGRRLMRRLPWWRIALAQRNKSSASVDETIRRQIRGGGYS